MKFRSLSALCAAFGMLALYGCSFDSSGLDVDAGGTGGTPGIGGSGGTAGSQGAGGTAGGSAGGSGAGGTGGTACDESICAKHCEHGNVLDAKGCPTCACNPAPACTRDKCGPLPPSLPCPNGQAPPTECVANAAGACAWKVGPCPACDTVLCDIACPFGNKLDDKGCAICSCNPAPACTAQECGPAPDAPTPQCEDGSTAGPVCERAPDSRCGWRIKTCPAACADARDARTCQGKDHCRWLEPGCSGKTLPAAGCFPRSSLNCSTQRPCASGKMCVTRTTNPCAAQLNQDAPALTSRAAPPIGCLACAESMTICQ